MEDILRPSNDSFHLKNKSLEKDSPATQLNSDSNAHLRAYNVVKRINTNTVTAKYGLSRFALFVNPKS